MNKFKMVCVVAFIGFNVLISSEVGYAKSNDTYVNEQNENSFAIKKRDRSAKISGIIVKGTTPIVENSKNLELQKSINDSIEKSVKERIDDAINKSSISVEFSYQEYTYENCYSIVLNTVVINSDNITKRVVDTFVFDDEKIIKIEDVLGVNGVNLLNKFISDEIKTESKKYPINFDKINDEQKFYLSKNKFIVVFDEQTLGVRPNQILEFKLNMKSLYSCMVFKDDYNKKGRYALKMVPLRAVCEELGYAVKWDSSNRIEISRNEFSTYIETGKNLYRREKTTGLELETSPESVNGVTYVPISFFEIILDITYAVDDNDNIFFNKYWK